MMFLFKRKKARQIPVTNVLNMPRMAFGHLQVKWAKWMTSHTRNFSKVTWRLLLWIFMLTAGGYSCYLTISACFRSGSKGISITPIRTPAHINENRDRTGTAGKTADSGYVRIQSFSVYMDSLAASPSGKTVYDSITTHRPGLMDSVRFIENYYQTSK